TAFVVVDDRRAAESEAGDLIAAERRPDATVADLLAGRVASPGGRTLFKSVGIASQDVAAARAALEEARRSGIGTQLGGSTRPRSEGQPHPERPGAGSEGCPTDQRSERHR